MSDLTSSSKEKTPADACAEAPAASALESSAREEKLAELELLRQSLQEKDGQIELYKDRWLRSQAEMENFRKRMDKERSESAVSILAGVLGLFLPVWDQLERAVGSLETQKGLDSKIKQGFLLILRNMAKIFEDHGLRKIRVAPGEPFDPHRHEVVRVEEGAGDDGVIVRVDQNGYMLGEKVLCPAKVVVSKKKSN